MHAALLTPPIISCSYAVVRSINYDGSGDVPGQSPSNLMSHGATLALLPAAEVTASCVIARPSHSEGTGPLYNQADIAKTVALPFSQKLDWFRAAALSLRTPWEDEHTFLFVRRENLIEDSIKSVMTLDRSQLRNMWRFEFIGEPGIDAGGVAREWFQVSAARARSIRAKATTLRRRNVRSEATSAPLNI